MRMMKVELVYVHDPMCSWCWAFRPVYNQIVRALPEGVVLKRLLGGLAPDTDDPMPDATREYVQNHWRTIQQKVPGTNFNFDFWEYCKPRRATYPACRAVIAARNQGDYYDDAMTLAIQLAYYLHARNPSETETLVNLAVELGLDKEKFSRDLESRETMNILMYEISTMQELGVDRFPTLLIKSKEETEPINIDYLNVQSVLTAIHSYI